MIQSRSHRSQPDSQRRSAQKRYHTSPRVWNTCVSKKFHLQKHDLIRHIPATEAFRASHAGPGATRAVVRDGATDDRGAVGDLNMMLDAMGELVAMSKATSSVRDGGRYPYG